MLNQLLKRLNINTEYIRQRTGARLVRADVIARNSVIVGMTDGNSRVTVIRDYVAFSLESSTDGVTIRTVGQADTNAAT